MSLFDSTPDAELRESLEPPERPERTFDVWIVTKPWMRGVWFVWVYSGGYLRMGFRRKRSAALDLARRWVAERMKRKP